MKMRTPFMVAIAIAVLAISVSVLAQTGYPAGNEAIREYMEQFGVSQAMPSPTDSQYWRPLSPVLGLLLREDGKGSFRATVYAYHHGQWVPVAVDGLSEVGPQYMYLQR